MSFFALANVSNQQVSYMFERGANGFDYVQKANADFKLIFRSLDFLFLLHQGKRKNSKSIIEIIKYQ